MLQTIALIGGHVPCACTEATRITIAGHSVPIGPVTVLFAVAILFLVPAVVYGWVRRRIEARAMRGVLDGPGSGSGQ